MTPPESLSWTTEPPPTPMLRKSETAKFVLTPARWENAAAGRGRPDGSTAQTSDVVPPMSRTRAP